MVVDHSNLNGVGALRLLGFADAYVYVLLYSTLLICIDLSAEASAGRSSM